MVRTGTIPVQTTRDGRLATEPEPLSLADVGRYPDGSAARAVARILFWAQWGNIPGVLDAYDRRIVRRLGVAQMAASVGWVAPSLSATRPRVTGVTRSGRATFVGVELLTRNYAPGRESFLVARTGGRWKVVWDTLLARSLAGSVIARLARDPRNPSASVRRAAQSAADRYRALGASIARRSPTASP
jgi:hypothetical protein